MFAATTYNPFSTQRMANARGCQTYIRKRVSAKFRPGNSTGNLLIFLLCNGGFFRTLIKLHSLSGSTQFFVCQHAVPAIAGVPQRTPTQVRPLSLNSQPLSTTTTLCPLQPIHKICSWNNSGRIPPETKYIKEILGADMETYNTTQPHKEHSA
jgi:hypothetical protein